MVSIHLSDEEKLFVLFVALLLFSSALFLSVCLAFPFCALNKWLLERHERRKAGRQGRHFLAACSRGFAEYERQAKSSNLFAAGVGVRAQLASSKCASLAPNSLGPPPAYEAALRASRLQSIASCSSLNNQQAEWCVRGQAHDEHEEEDRQLQLGDYFHAPKESAPQDAVVIPIGGCWPAPGGSSPLGARKRRLPVRVRLWVKLLEPGELIERARAQMASDNSSEQRQQCEQSPSHCSPASNLIGRRLSRQLSLPQLLGSLRSSLAGAQEPEAPRPLEQLSVAGGDGQQALSSLSSTTTTASDSPSANEQQPADSRPREQQRSRQAKQRRGRAGARLQALTSGCAITSRVLHMNVASFSFLKDDNYISAKRHNQLNWRHFGGCTKAAGGPGGSQSSVKMQQESKSCQLLISVCDVENLLTSSCLSERPSAHLAASTSICVQCEILAPSGGRAAAAKSVARHLLRNPLKAVLQPSDQEQRQQHETVDLAATLPAAALAQPPVVPPRPQLSQPEDALNGPPGAPAADWRHAPEAAGKPIVLFQSVPKQIQQQIAETDNCGSTPMAGAASSSPGASMDLIQFDSVFVTPILSKSIIESGAHLKLRIYAQCKHLNDTCLVELKLPLRQLLKTRTRDNLGDSCNQAGHSSQSSEYILDNLLANLVSAGTGSPLVSLLEQIRAEQEAEEETIDEGACEPEDCGQAERQPQSQQNGLFNKWWPQAQPVDQHSVLGSAREPLESAAETSGEAQPNGEEWLRRQWKEDELMEQNYFRSLMVSHWLNYLVAPSYECQPVEERRGQLVLSLNWLPTSNRVVFSVHSATIELEHLGAAPGDLFSSNASLGGPQPPNASKQLIKKLRLQADTSYLVRFLMVSKGRVLKKKQTRPSRRLEWSAHDGQEAPVTFDLVNVSAEQPVFVVALVLRSAHSNHKPPASGGGDCGHSQLDGESAARFVSGASGAVCRLNGESPPERRAGRRDLVVGHLVLAEQMWRELRAEPRREIVKQFQLM